MQEELIPAEVTCYSFTRTIWKGLVPPRVELFVWFVLIGRVNTKDRLSRFGIISQEDVTCVLCNNGVDDVHHLFLGCIFTWQVWSAWTSAFGQRWSYPGSMKEHFLSWTEEPRRMEERNHRLRCFCAIVWNLWLERNRRIFQHTSKEVEEIINMSSSSTNEWSGVDPFRC
ncbi:hypothetical protein AHAS_Ahas12G0186000 [Arachis hypogaea]